MPHLKNIGVLLRSGTDAEPLQRLRALFERNGAQVFLLNDALPEVPLDLVIAMGGDGTVLKALDLFVDCPVVAINYGNVGFLTAGDREDLERLIGRVLAGDYLVSRRLMLRIEHPGGVVRAVNEVVLRSSNRMVSVDVHVDGTKIRTIRGDGMIVGTPTGSTGYLLATGAPLVMPDVDCMILDGINEYNFTSRALILAPDKLVRLYVPALMPEQEVTIHVDGNVIGRLGAGQELRVTQAGQRASLIYFEENYFFHNLSSRLSWN